MTEQCAVWYFRYYQIYYEVCDSEREAANYAVGLVEWENGSPQCVQFPDGRVLSMGDWPAYAEAERRMLEAEKERAARLASAPPRPTRKVKAPFGDGRQVEVDADDPAWLGRGA